MWSPLSRRGGGLPLYKQVEALIEGAVADGRLGGGERLPSERRLCALLGVNRSTVIQALDELADRGVLLRRRGSGTYVNGDKWGVQQYPVLNWRPPVLGTRPGGQAARIAACREEARRAGRLLCDLAGSDLPPDLAPDAAVPEGSWRELLRQELDEESSLVGLLEFREAVRDHLRECLDLETDADQILITSGARQALFLITQCLLRPGEAVGMEAPSYFYSLPLFQAAGLRLFAIPTDKEGVLPDELDDLITRRGLRMVFLNPAFQNPSGHVMSESRKRVVLRLCSARRVPIVEDDAYSLLAFSPQAGAAHGSPAFLRQADTAPIKRFDAHGQTLYIGSVSSYMGRNVRAGWLVAPRGVVQKLADVRRQMDAGLSVLPQILAGHFLRHDLAGRLGPLRAELARRALALRQTLDDILPAHAAYDPPEGGMHLYLRPHPDAGTGDDILEALLGHNILPAPGAEFGDAEGRFRLNFGQYRG